MKKIIIVLFVAFICAMWICSTTNQNEVSVKEPEIKFTDDLGYVPPASQKKVKIEAKTGIYLESGYNLQALDFMNLSENNYDMKVMIYLGDGTLLYESGYIQPGEEIDNAEFRIVPERGTYSNALIVYKFYSPDSKHVYASQCETPVEIKVI